MWGTLLSHFWEFLFTRFIPTHVGNAKNNTDTVPQLSVHPHACGERLELQRLSAYVFGSSPRMWGTLMHVLQCVPLLRFIPTHVGNAYPAAAEEITGTVHPHACGERTSCNLLLHQQKSGTGNCTNYFRPDKAQKRKVS